MGNLEYRVPCMKCFNYFTVDDTNVPTVRRLCKEYSPDLYKNLGTLKLRLDDVSTIYYLFADKTELSRQNILLGYEAKDLNTRTETIQVVDFHIATELYITYSVGMHHVLDPGYALDLMRTYVPILDRLGVTEQDLIEGESNTRDPKDIPVGYGYQYSIAATDPETGGMINVHLDIIDEDTWDICISCFD